MVRWPSGRPAVATDDRYFRITLYRVGGEGDAADTTEIWLDDVEGDASPSGA